MADATNEHALEPGLTANAPEAFGAYGGFLYVIRLQQGRLDEIADPFIDAARDNPSIAVLRASVTAMLTHLGRVDEGNERLRAEASADFDFPTTAPGSPRCPTHSTSPLQPATRPSRAH